jgi:hypothetical protein
VSFVAGLKDPYYDFPFGFLFLFLSSAIGIYLARRLFGSRIFEEITRDVPFHIDEVSGAQTFEEGYQSIQKLRAKWVPSGTVLWPQILSKILR